MCEFLRQRRRLLGASPSGESLIFISSQAAAPTFTAPAFAPEIDWRNHLGNHVTPVRDQGGGFDVAKVVPDVTTPEHLLDMRGRGIFIMRSCCDEVFFDFTSEGTVCHLVKYRAAARRAADA